MTHTTKRRMSSLQPFCTNYNYTINSSTNNKTPFPSVFNEWRERKRERERVYFGKCVFDLKRIIIRENKDILRRRKTGDVRFGFILTQNTTRQIFNSQTTSSCVN